MDVLNVLKTVDMVIKIATPIIENVSAKLAPEMKQFAERLYKFSEKYPQLEEWALVIENGAEILTDILYALGVDCDIADEIGFKANQSDRKLSEFDSVESYVKYLHDEVKLDKEKIDALSNEEKIAYRATGMAVEAAVVGGKIGVEISPDFVILISKLKMAGDMVLEVVDLVSLLDGIKEKGISKTKDIVEYFMGEGDSDRIYTGEVLRTKFEEIYGEKAADIIEVIKMQERPE